MLLSGSLLAEPSSVMSAPPADTHPGHACSAGCYAGVCGRPCDTTCLGCATGPASPGCVAELVAVVFVGAARPETRHPTSSVAFGAAPPTTENLSPATQNG